jgi:predicted ester cyclase
MPGGERLGVAEWLEEEAAYLTAFPDGRMAIEAQVAEGDTVATLITFRGTQRGDLRGIPATGKVVELSGILWSRVLEGVIVEHREEYNLLGLMQQLDAMPMEGEG